MLQLALEAYRQVLSEVPQHAVAWNGVGLVLVELKRFEDAKHAFSHSVEADPANASAHYNLSFTLSHLGDYDVVINATASSLQEAAVPVPSDVLRPGTLALDMMYGPAAQPFLAWARARGAVGRDGLGMLVEQAAESWAIWRGQRPPSAQVLTELRAALEAGNA